MKQTVRFKTFETNSSSYHSCCILTDAEYQEYQKGNVFISKYNDHELVSKEEVMVSVSKKGYCKRSSIKSYSASDGVNPSTKENDILVATLKSNLMYRHSTLSSKRN